MYIANTAGSAVKNQSAMQETTGNVGEADSILELGRSRREGRRKKENGNPLRYSCLKNSMELGRLQSAGSQRFRHNLVTKVKVLVTQFCLTLCDPTDCSLPFSSAHGIFQAKTPEWVPISYSRGSSWPGDWICVSCVTCFIGRFFTVWANRKVHFIHNLNRSHGV